MYIFELMATHFLMDSVCGVDKQSLCDFSCGADAGAVSRCGERNQ